MRMWVVATRCVLTIRHSGNRNPHTNDSLLRHPGGEFDRQHGYELEGPYNSRPPFPAPHFYSQATGESSAERMEIKARCKDPPSALG